ncbi:helix-turn-helix transcriptional regulator [Phaeospirillum tilakii]|uniref:Helix-turn-helix transcriptional regulator n=1 Tax=Phaeospirillum tilakii TaxID=741673 RepID=A0ABW5CFR1_9PROT
MTPDSLRAWRASCGLSQEAAARALDISRRTYQYREEGKSSIGREAALACAAISAGLKPWGEEVETTPSDAPG